MMMTPERLMHSTTTTRYNTHNYNVGTVNSHCSSVQYKAQHPRLFSTQWYNTRTTAARYSVLTLDVEINDAEHYKYLLCSNSI